MGEIVSTPGVSAKKFLETLRFVLTLVCLFGGMAVVVLSFIAVLVGFVIEAHYASIIPGGNPAPRVPPLTEMEQWLNMWGPCVGIGVGMLLVLFAVWLNERNR